MASKPLVSDVTNSLHLMILLVAQQSNNYVCCATDKLLIRGTTEYPERMTFVVFSGL